MFKLYAKPRMAPFPHHLLPSSSVKLCVISVLLCVPFLLIGCRPKPVPPPTPIPPPQTDIVQIGVAGSATAVTPLVTSANPQAQFITGSTDTLLDDLENGRLDAILIHHLPADLPNYFNPVALDGLVIVVHPALPIGGLSRADIQAIFNGRIQNWSAVGGPDLPITLISREAASGTRALFVQHIMAAQRISINALIQPDDVSLRTAVADTPGAVGYSMMGNSQTGEVKVLAVDGRLPTPTTTADQSYPLTAPLYFVSADTSEPTGALRSLLAWMQSDAGQAALEGVGYGRVR